MGLKKGRKNLAAGRPPIFHQKPKSITRKATKSLINTHHLLQKKRHQAIRDGDETAKAAVDAEISALGGLERYQQASLQGQRKDRGGDSSRVLVDWVKESLDPRSPPQQDGPATSQRRLRLLEVGALSTDNACSRSEYFEIERIDLNSQSEGILQQDFMKRLLPRDDSQRFDIISLSLVVNFVPDPVARGEMLLRTLQFLRSPSAAASDGAPAPHACTPSLFLVLPAPCVSNSRYLDEPKLTSIMQSVGYILLHTKATQRLVYYLWKRATDTPSKREAFPKKELRSGPSRNNFAIVL